MNGDAALRQKPVVKFVSPAHGHKMGVGPANVTSQPTVRVRLRDTVLRGAEPPPVEFLTRRPEYPWWVVGVTCVGAFIGQLDASIVQLALPHLRDVFHSRLDEVSWVSLAYLLAFASTLPIFGRLCELFGRKLLYLVGFAVFSAASALCGFAGSLEELVGFRILQGIGGAMLGANSISILVRAVDPGRRARAMGIFAAAQAIGVSAGPIAGGLLLGALGWRWIFWVTVPFGVMATVLGWLILPRTERAAGERRFDGWGAVLLLPGLTALMLVLNQFTVWGAMSPRILGCALAAAVLIALFIRHEVACPYPLVDLQLFRSPAFTFGGIGAILEYALLYGMFFVVSFALVRGYGDSPEVAGMRLAVLPASLGIVASLSGGWTKRVGGRRLCILGMSFCGVSLGWLAVCLSTPALGRIADLSALGLFGAGLGLYIAPNNHGTMEAAPPNHSGQAGALLNLLRVSGTSLGVASTSAVLSWRLAAGGDFQIPTQGFAGAELLHAAVETLTLLAGFAVLAVAVSLVSRKPSGQARPD